MQNRHLKPGRVGENAFSSFSREGDDKRFEDTVDLGD